MISRIILICVLTAYNSAFDTGKFNPYGTTSKQECQPNRVYQKDDVTCFCNKYGRWPHKNCSLVFNQQATCTPDSFIQVDCNVCRCSKTGNIEREFCTNHICSAEPNNKIILRRYNSGKRKCELNRWYELTACRLCFCITRENLLCAAKTNPKKVEIGKFNLTDCGPEWLSDINKLLSSVNPLRLGDQLVNLNSRELDRIENVRSPVIVDIQSTPTVGVPKGVSKTLNLNQKIVGNKYVKIARNDDRSDKNELDSSSESNTEEKLKEDKIIARISGNTVMPFENDDENDSNNSYEVENDRKESDNELADNKNELEEEDVSKEVESAVESNKNEPTQQNNVIGHESDESLLKLNLPGMLGKVFNFGIRKSMVSITESNCVPGSTLSIKCNACFCLTNGKMLCTKKICE